MSKKRRKIVPMGEVFFKGDISINESEVAKPLNLPTPYMFEKDVLLILFDGQVLTLSKDLSGSDYVKIYTMKFGVEEVETPKELEDAYFKDYQALLDKLKKEFIENAVGYVPILSKSGTQIKKRFGKQIGKTLISKIDEIYLPKKPRQSSTKLNDGSIFNSELEVYDKFILLDGKLYELNTISEYLDKFEKAFEPSFYKELKSMSKTAIPQEVAKEITENKTKVHPEGLPVIRDKIWSNEKSSEFFLHGQYFIPWYGGRWDSVLDAYRRLIEKMVKIDAVKQYMV